MTNFFVSFFSIRSFDFYFYFLCWAKAETATQANSLKILSFQFILHFLFPTCSQIFFHISSLFDSIKMQRILSSSVTKLHNLKAPQIFYFIFCPLFLELFLFRVYVQQSYDDNWFLKAGKASETGSEITTGKQSSTLSKTHVREHWERREL